MATEEWLVRFHSEIAEDLEGISDSDAEMILNKIQQKLTVAPADFGKRLKNDLHPLLRLRVGDYRIVYELKPRERRVRILLVGKRKDIYKIAKKIAAERISSE